MGQFDFCEAMTGLCEDISRRHPEFGHVQMPRVAVTFAQARSPVHWGVQARLTPLRFEGGRSTEHRKGRLWTVQKVLIEAIVLAYDIYCSFCKAVDVNAKGWDQPLYTVLGCALGAAKLLQLDADQTGHALSLALTPMSFLSGVFFPLQQLPGPLQAVAWCLPLSHAASLARGLALGDPMPWPWISHLTDADIKDVFAYLQSIPAVRNRVPAPIDPPEAPASTQTH